MKKLKRKYHYLIAIFCMLSAILYLWLHLSQYPRAHFPLRHVIVEGEYWQVPQSDLESIITPYIESGYFLISLSSLQQQLLEKEPWLESVAASRQWPDTLNLDLTQRIAVAVWNKNGLISDTGDVFSPPATSFPPDLPQFFCVKEKVHDVLKQYHLFTSVANSANLSVSTIKLTPEGSWSVGLSNNIVVMLGDKDILARFTRFIKVYTKVFVPEHREPSYVDMRYGHGMAVQWKS